jgi:hypothetical protein
MNWIGRPSNYLPIHVQQEPADEIKQQQSPAPLSTIGIAATNDQFETVNPAISQFTPSLPSQQEMSTVMTQQSPSELVSAAGIFESVNNLDSDLFRIGTPEIQQPPAQALPPVQAPPPKIDWDAVLAVKQEIYKDPMDWNAIFTRLEQIPNSDDFAHTLGEFWKDGDLVEFLKKLPSEGCERLGDLLTRAADDQVADGKALTVLLDSIRRHESTTSEPKGRFSETIRQFIESSGGKLDPDRADLCLSILKSDPSSENRLSNLFAMKQLVQNPQLILTERYLHDMFDQEIFQFSRDYANGIVEVPAPGIQKAWEKYPEFSQEAVSIGASNFPDEFASNFADRLIESGENVGPALSEFIRDSALRPSLSRFLEEMCSRLSAAVPAKADDMIREAINNSTGDFSKLSPGLLIELKFVLLRGDETDLNLQMINEIIDPAYEIAKNN